MSLLAALTRAAAAQRLCVTGIAPVLPADGLPPRIRAVVLLSPDEPGFWPHVTASPEFRDARPQPLDRWSRRVIGRIACDAGAKAWFPFGGPLWRPFTTWALRSGQAFTAPVGLAVHAARGLLVSWRGAIGVTEALVPTPALRPCDTCAAPCRGACPVSAFAGGSYDVAACYAYLNTPPGAACLSGGCQVRRACPLGQNRRLPDQSAFHMKAFHPS